MISQRQLFLNHVGQTSDTPMMLEVEKAEGVYIFDTDGKKYFDLIAGVSVSNLGHGHPAVKAAVKEQVDKYMHLMVYGEYVQTPQVEYAKLLTDQLPEGLNSIFYVNSGSEANEGALKLAKRYTGRSEIVAFRHAYHGHSHGAMSLISDTDWTQNFRPLLPDIRFLDYNQTDQLAQITERTACVVAEAIQAEAGIIEGNHDFIRALRKRCDETGTLLIFDEVQTGFGRTGKLFGFEHYNIVPDIFTIAKGMGGGMPIGAFVARKEIMDSLKNNPILGHITTFGGHPVSAAAAVANLRTFLNENILDEVEAKGTFFREQLSHSSVRSIRGKGLFLAVELGSFEKVQTLIKGGLRHGFLSDWFLFNDKHFRIAPPLTITFDEIAAACTKIKAALDEL